MSNLLDKASILLTPTAYDNGRMLSVKPNENLYGSELVTNGDFATDSDWTKGTGWTIANGKASQSGGNATLQQSGILTANKTYKLVFEITEITSGSVRCYFGGNYSTYRSSTGTYTEYITNGSTSTFFIQGNVSFAGSIDNVSVVEDLSGDFQFSRSSAATRVNAQGLVENVQIISSELVSNGNFSQIGTEEVLNGNFSQESSELITNGSFDTDSDWSKVNATISGGTGNLNGTGVTSLLFQNILTDGKTYTATFTISDYNGSGSAKIINSNGDTYYTITENGTFTIYFKHIFADGLFYFRAISGAAYSIDNVSVKEVGQNWSLGDGWTISNLGATCSDLNNNLTQDVGVTAGKVYKVTLDVTDYISGTLAIDIGGSSNQTATSLGSKTFYFTTTSTGLLRFYGGAFRGTITNISVKEVGQDWTVANSDANNYVEFNQEQGTARLKFLNTSPITEFYTSTNPMIGGRTYQLTVDVAEATSGSIKIDGGGISQQVFNTAGINTRIISPTSNTNVKFYRASANVDITLNSVSLKEITDDTNIPRINYEGFSYQDTLGSEEIVNGDFSNGSANWFNPDGAATFSNNSVTINGGSGNRRINQPNVTSPTTSQFKLQYEITEKVGTSDLKVYTNNSGSAAYTIVPSTIGVHTFYFSSNLTTFYFNFSDSSGSITIDNVSVKEVTGQEVVPDSGCGSWLLEPQSTNLITYSEDFSLWANGTTYTTQNYSVSPSGEQNASRCLFTGANQNIQLSFSNSAETTASIYVKGVSGETIRFGTSFQENNFTLDGTWQRLSITRSVSPYSFAISISTYGGATARDIEIWGAQVENLSYATSYIPTNGATNTRLQDIATNSGNSTLINSTEGVLYAEIAALADDGTNRIISLSENGNIGNRVNIFYTSGSNKVKFVVRVNNSNVFDDTITLSDIVAYNKIALKYKENDFAIWINGIKETEQLSGSTYSENTLDKLNFDQGSGSFPFYGNTKALAVYKEALTDAELQSLTTI